MEVTGVGEEASELEPEGETIVITGSRIRSDPLDKQAPVQQLTREEIERSGLTSVADILQHLPVSGGSLNTRFNSSGNFGFPPDGGGIGAGAAQADLRSLGSKRVLVLVDGIRWVNGSSASGVSGATDLNTIPVGIIERIEVLEDGASPIYGSDAIAGVINIITRKDLDGAVANAYTGGYHQRDGLTQQYDVSWGQTSERMSIIVSTSIVDQQRISANDRDLSRFPIPGITECTNNCSSGTPQGRFFLTDPNTGEALNLTINEGVGGTPRYDPADPGGAGDDFNPFDTADRFNFSPYNLMMTPSRRVGVFSGVRYKIADAVSFRGTALFNNRQSANQAAPEPLFVGPEAGNGNRLDRISIHETNPYNPFGFTIDAATNPYFIGRRPLEAGPRIFEQTVNTWYVSGGLYGDVAVGDRTFYWDTTLAYGINRADQLKRGAFNSAKLETALGPAYTDSAGRSFCGTPDNPGDPNCVPFNIFGGQGADGNGTITQEMLNYVSFVQHDISEQELMDVTANVAGGIIPLPAGDISLAAGIEHRRLSGFFEPDPIVVAGDSAGIPAQPTDGSYTVNEAYAELQAPLVARMPGVDLLDVNGAVRVSSYSTFGTEATFKAGARWRPIKDLMFRGSFGQGFRAPGIGELFGSDARFDQNLDDPCSDMLGLNGGTPAPQNVIDNCVARGVPADGSYQQFNQQISITTGGNETLDPETSQSITASVVYSPTWLIQSSPWIDRLNLEVTYFNIGLDEAISPVDAQVVLDSCYQTGDPVFCDRIGRTPTGVINSFSNQLENIGSIATSGLGITLGYTAPNTEFGRIRVTSNSNILLEFTETVPATPTPDNPDGLQDIERVGTEVGDPERAFPRFKSTLVLDWFFREWRASLTTRYTHSVREPCRDLQDFDFCSDYDTEDDSNSTNLLSPMVYNDAQVTWTPRKLENALDLTVGVNNLFNRDPPACYSCALNGFDASTYDIPGVFGYLKASYRMY
ncbi:MAG: TonB-dependent receptor [Haliangiales bacterium]